MNIIDNLTANFSKFPGIGKKSASRMVYYLLNTPESFNLQLAQQIADLKRLIKRCDKCFAFTEESPCPICSDSSRDSSLICVVEQPSDVKIIESTGSFKGLYHVLNGTISPLEGRSPDSLTIRQLIARISADRPDEIILALNPTVEGDTTALYLTQLIKPLGIKVSKLASGLPVGGDIEYADSLTISKSLNGRIDC
ncbi:MAG: recombination protein RecR [Spirochaetales bacterium]|nr:recombination protein RecR [Spirochaetales bacterium]